MKMIDWLSSNFPRKPPNQKLARKAVRHLKRKEKKQLFSNEISQMRAAEGRWYEALIYEMILEISNDTDLIAGIVRKGADAPFPPLEIALGQNGLFFSARGDIKVRGNGQDLAEVDLLLQSSSNSIAFAEIVTSTADLKALEDEVRYKKSLLGYIFGQPHVPFILFSSVDISRSAIIRRLTREPDSVLIVTQTCEEIKKMLKERDIRGVPRKPVKHDKLITLDSIPPLRPFDYKHLHELRRRRVLRRLSRNETLKPGVSRDEIPPIVKKVLLGALYPSGMKTFLQESKFGLKNEPISLQEAKSRYSKIILAIDLPEYEPVMYFRVRDKKEYLKVVPVKSGGFRVESRRGQRIKGFYLWLESLEPSIGAKIAHQYTHAFLKNR